MLGQRQQQLSHEVEAVHLLLVRGGEIHGTGVVARPRPQQVYHGLVEGGALGGAEAVVVRLQVAVQHLVDKERLCGNASL